MQAPDASCCCLSLVLKGQWRLWPTGCQWEAGSSSCPVRTTLPSCWSTSPLVCCSEASPSPGGSLPFMFSRTRHWRHSSVMNFIWSSTSLTRNTEKHLYPSCYNKISVMPFTWPRRKTVQFKCGCESVRPKLSFLSNTEFSWCYKVKLPPLNCISSVNFRVERIFKVLF